MLVYPNTQVEEVDEARLKELVPGSNDIVQALPPAGGTENGDVLPAASVAVAVRVLVAVGSSVTLTFH